MIILVKLILAHLLGDFLLQPDSWVAAKENKKLAACQLYLHTLIHFTLIMLLVFDLSFWKWAAAFTVAHFSVDVAKLYTIKEKARRQYFLIDQAAHFILIFGIWFVFQSDDLSWQNLPCDLIFLWFTAVYALTAPASTAIKHFISKWSPQSGIDDEDSLQEAGKYIGMLERLFVFAFVLSEHWEAIGFLLAAKSIFRFGDLKDSKERKLTEYVLIGTLLSFGIAILVGIVSIKLSRHLY